jgi:large subunit ribosomal protein L30
VKRLRIKQVKSGIGRLKNHKRVLRALGLRHPGSVVEHDDSVTIRGMVEKVKHLVVVDVVDDEGATSETQ